MQKEVKIKNFSSMNGFVQYITANNASCYEIFGQ